MGASHIHNLGLSLENTATNSTRAIIGNDYPDSLDRQIEFCEKQIQNGSQFPPSMQDKFPPEPNLNGAFTNLWNDNYFNTQLMNR